MVRPESKALAGQPRPGQLSKVIIVVGRGRATPSEPARRARRSPGTRTRSCAHPLVAFFFEPHTDHTVAPTLFASSCIVSSLARGRRTWLSEVLKLCVLADLARA